MDSPRRTTRGKTCQGVLKGLWCDRAGQSLRHYVLAVVAAAFVVIVVLTLLAERIYIAALELFGPT